MIELKALTKKYNKEKPNSFKALDTTNADAIMKLFERFHNMGKTVIIVTHNQELAERCNRQIEIVDGSVKS